MLTFRQIARLVSLALLSLLTSCANSSTGKNLEEILAADPRLQSNPVDFGSAQDPQRQTQTAQLPPNFPQQIPLYPNSQLKEVTQANPQATEELGNSASSQAEVTRWQTNDPSNVVQSFYQNEFQGNNWEILSQLTNEQGGTFEARRDNLQVTVSIQPTVTNPESNPTSIPSQPPTRQNQQTTEFTIQYFRNNITATSGQPIATTAPQPGNPDFIGPLLPSTSSSDANTDITTTATPTISDTSAASSSQVFTDINKAPQELRQHIQDLAKLGVLPLEPTSSKSSQTINTTQFEPSKTISRREYARWLVAANNAIHANSAAKQIRLASETAQPAFQDVLKSDPDFAVIQGLAEAGLISSPLSGDSTTVLFRPNAPLTREQLILWKVPLDTRQGLPTASLDAVKETWGFQDASRIDPKALRAVLADFQNSEQSNIRRVFGYTTLFQPKRSVTRAEAAAALWFFGNSTEGVSASEALQINNQQPQPEATSGAIPTTPQ